MVALFIETSTERSILFFYDGTVRYCSEFPVGLNNSKYLFPALQRGLNELGVKLQELSFIAVGVGPGSYTGMRVGATVAKGLAFGCKLPLIAVPTLKCFGPHASGRFAVVIDAKIRGCYAIFGSLENGVMTYTTDSRVMPLEDLARELVDVEWVLTPKSDILKVKVEKIIPHLTCKWLESSPQPSVMGGLGQKLFAEAGGAVNHTLDLLYLGSGCY